MVTNLSYAEKLAFFFGSTPRSGGTGNYHSTLALIRADIKTCGKPGSQRLVFPRAMCLMVAVDLMATMYAGTDTQGGSGARFKAFINAELSATFGQDIGEKIWAFRCALHHSYRMPTEWGRRNNITNSRFRLMNNRKEARMVWSANANTETFINFFRLHAEIEAAIGRFHAAAAVCPVADQHKFSDMFNKYGWLLVD